MLLATWPACCKGLAAWAPMCWASSRSSPRVRGMGSCLMQRTPAHRLVVGALHAPRLVSLLRQAALGLVSLLGGARASFKRLAQPDKHLLGSVRTTFAGGSAELRATQHALAAVAHMALTALQTMVAPGSCAARALPAPAQLQLAAAALDALAALAGCLQATDLHGLPALLEVVQGQAAGCEAGVARVLAHLGPLTRAPQVVATPGAWWAPPTMQGPAWVWVH
jgi:hypothetical protein